MVSSRRNRRPPMNQDTRRPLAVVTGASAGIGYQLARICAENGFDLLVAADQPKIHEAAQEFRALGAAVEAVEADLATLEGVDRLYAAPVSRARRRTTPAGRRGSTKLGRRSEASASRTRSPGEGLCHCPSDALIADPQAIGRNDREARKAPGLDPDGGEEFPVAAAADIGQRNLLLDAAYVPRNGPENSRLRDRRAGSPSLGGKRT
jgi:hypothetical protein